jgi:hypothetical protein
MPRVTLRCQCGHEYEGVKLVHSESLPTLLTFQKFYEPHGLIADFIRAVKEDRSNLELKPERVDEDTQ